MDGMDDMAGILDAYRSALGVLALGVALCAWTAGPVWAGGGSSFGEPPLTSQHTNAQGSGNTAARAGETVTVSGAGFDYTGTAGATASTQTQAGQTVVSVVLGGSGGGASKAGVSVTNTETVTSFTKGSNTLEQGRSETLATIHVNGHAYVVVDEVAAAVARTTQFGSASAAAVDTSVSSANGYSAPVTAAKGAR